MFATLKYTSFTTLSRARWCFCKSEIGYRFHFNGKENDSETYGEGNALDFGARIYDSRLGRWLSVDQFARKYTDLSPYTYSCNNPISLVDIGGDSTIYYTMRGNIIFISHDGLENAMVIIDDKNLVDFRNQVTASLKTSASDEHSNSENEKWRNLGILVPIKQFEIFFDKYSKKHKGGGSINKINGSNVLGIIDKTTNKKIEIYDEYAADLHLIGNKIEIGAIGDAGSPQASSRPDKKGSQGGVHLHPITRNPITLTLENGKGSPIYIDHQLSSGPSFEDKQNAPKGSINMVIDDKSLIIYIKDKSNNVTEYKFDKGKRFSN